MIENHCCDFKPNFCNLRFKSAMIEDFYKRGYYLNQNQPSTLLKKIELCTITRIRKPWVKLTKIFFSYQFQNHSSSIYKICLFQVCITLAKNDPIKKVFHMKHLDLKSRFFILRTNTFNLWIFYRTVHLKLNEFGKLADFIWKCFGLLLILTAETSIILHRQYNIFIFHFHCLLVNCYYFSENCFSFFRDQIMRHE